jgi:hypothetical protein
LDEKKEKLRATPKIRRIQKEKKSINWYTSILMFLTHVLLFWYFDTSTLVVFNKFQNLIEKLNRWKNLVIFGRKLFEFQWITLELFDFRFNFRRAVPQRRFSGHQMVESSVDDFKIRSWRTESDLYVLDKERQVARRWSKS